MYPKPTKSPPLPSLNALMAFDAAARHESFTRAALELGVTQTAVSHQIKALEEELGVALFRRAPRKLALTRDGMLWAAEVQVVFQRLRDANLRLRQSAQARRPIVSVSVMPSFGARWLVPRLGRFMERHPDVDVHLSASERLVDFGAEPFDLGIRYGMGRYPGLACEKLADDAWVVITSPSWSTKNRVRNLRDLSRCTLLSDDHPNAWGEWFTAAGHPGIVPRGQVQITDSSMLVEAVLRGQGIGLARWSLACDELQNGRLELLFPKYKPLRTTQSYFVVGPRESFRLGHVRDFRDWLLGEARSLRV